jgi:hypothetical protein
MEKVLIDEERSGAETKTEEKQRRKRGGEGDISRDSKQKRQNLRK